MPDKTLPEKGDVVKRGKMAKERLTVLFCCSASGEKLKPLVIGKARKPRAFSGVNVSRLPCSDLEIKQQGMDEYYHIY